MLSNSSIDAVTTLPSFRRAHVDALVRRLHEPRRFIQIVSGAQKIRDWSAEVTGHPGA